ncbi:MAG: efflux RND transporter permease subunit [Candidatus Aminicenantes bacterium]
MKITRIAVSRPVTISMFFSAVILLGLVSLRELSVDLLPDISYPRLSVITRYPGVAPEEIETLVTQRLESSLLRIPGIRRVESVSAEGGVYMTLEFAWGTDMDFAMLHTREKLDSVLLPEEAEKPAIIPLDPQSQPIMVLSVSGRRSLLELREFSEELIKPRLEQMEGIGSAEIAGGVEREIHVELDPRLITLYGLDIQDVSRRIEAYNRNLQGGTIRKGRFKYALRIQGEFEELKEIGEISLKTTEDRSVIRLQNVARIRDGIKEREGITRLNGSESIGILVRKEAGANTVQATASANKVIQEIIRTNPGIQILTVSAQAEYIQNAITSVRNAILYGAVLAFFILVLFLQDLKTPLIIATAIPVAVVSVFNLMYFMNITVNIMSLGGLALGVGMLVDNSVVVSESIFRHRSLGKSLRDAAYTGTREVGMAVTASTFTTISVFLPVIYVHGVAGQLFKDQALTVTFAMLSSLVVALTLLPMLASRKFSFSEEISGEKTNKPGLNLFRNPPRKSFPSRLLYPFWFVRQLLYAAFKLAIKLAGFIISLLIQLFVLLLHYLSIPVKHTARTVFRGFNFVYNRFSRFYHDFLVWSLDHKSKVAFGSLLFLLITLLAATQLPRELMPKPETSTFELHLKTPVDYSLEQTGLVVERVEEWMDRHPGIGNTFSQTGVVSGMEAMNPDVSLNFAKIHVETASFKKMNRVIEESRAFLSRFPEVRHSIVPEQSTLAQFLAFTSSEIGLKIKGENLDVLTSLAGELAARLQNVQGIADINTNIAEGKPEFLIRVKREALEKFNISTSQIGRFLVDAVRGRVDTQFKELEKKYDIRVKLQDDTRQNVDALLEEQILHQNTRIPLRELVTYEIARGPKEIRRENQEREVVVTANLKGAKISQVVPLIQAEIDALPLPSGYRVVFSGEQEEMQKSFRSLIFALLLAVLLVYMIMSAQFESLLHPFVILLTLPMGLTGSIWALYLTGQSLNVISLIGMVVLAGIVVNDAIVKIDYTNQLRRKGKGLREAVMEAGRIRLRPILMTTVTTAFGLFPMSLGLGQGAELQQPLAISVIGGLMLATFLTLILIPLGYEAVEKTKAKTKT